MEPKMMYVWRCERTNNPVGTDTIMIGAPPCDCRGCRGVELQATLRDLHDVLAAKVAPSEGLMDRVRAVIHNTYSKEPYLK